MKNRFFSAPGVCLAAVLGLGIATQASAATGELLTVKLPYETAIGKSILPAGDYTVRGLGTESSTSVLEFVSASGHGISVLVSEISAPNGQEATRSQIILRSENGKYQIDKVWLEGLDHGFQLQTSNGK
jgi:hypothetical protein